MGSSVTKFIAQTVECDFRNTYCPKCETTCDQCGRSVIPALEEPKNNFDYDNGLILFPDCYNVGICHNYSVNLPSDELSKHLITVICLKCDQNNKYHGGGRQYFNYTKRLDMGKNFDLTQKKHIVKKLDPLINKNIVKKCCKNCTDIDTDMSIKLRYKYLHMANHDMTSYHIYNEDINNENQIDEYEHIY